MSNTYCFACGCRIFDPPPIDLDETEDLWMHDRTTVNNIGLHTCCYKWLGMPSPTELASIPISLLTNICDGRALFTPDEWIEESLRSRIRSPAHVQIESFSSSTSSELLKPLHLRSESFVPLHCKYIERKFPGNGVKRNDDDDAELSQMISFGSKNLTLFEVYLPKQQFGYAHLNKRTGEYELCSLACRGHVPTAMIKSTTAQASTPISALLSSLGSRIRQTSRKICTTYIFTHRPDRIRSILQRETSRVIEEEDKRLFTLLLGTHKRVGADSPMLWLPKELVKMIGTFYKHTLPFHLPQVIFWESRLDLESQPTVDDYFNHKYTYPQVTDPEWEMKLVIKM